MTVTTNPSVTGVPATTVVATLGPTGDSTGTADYISLTSAIALATAAGGGVIEFLPGIYYTKPFTGGDNRNIPSNTTLYCKQPYGAVIRRANIAGNYDNQVTLNGVTNVVIDGFDFDGQNTLVTGLPASDANGNGIRVVNSNNWVVRNTKLRNQPFHGLIAVQSSDGFVIENVIGTGNGYRSIHVHSEANTYARRGKIRNVQSFRNGTNSNHFWMGTATTSAASAVVQLQAGAGAQWAAMFTAAGGAGQCFFTMAGAGTSASFLIETVLSVNSGADQITLSRVVPTTVTTGPAYGIGESTTGMFLTYGSDDIHYSDIHIWDEPAWGIQLAGSSDTLLNNVFQGVGTIYSNALNKLYLTTTDYATFKTAYNALTAPQKALTTVNIDGVGVDSCGFTSAITSFNDADSTVTLTTSSTYPANGARLISTYTVASGGTFTAPSTNQTIKGLTINNCGFGLRLENLQDVSFSGLKVSNSLIHGIWQLSGTSVKFDSTCSIVNSGACPWLLNAVVDSTNNSFDGHINGAGAGVNLFNAANKKLTNTSFGPTALIENCGLNAHFRQATNFLGTIVAVGIFAHNDNGNGVVEGPKVVGAEIARNHRGGIRLSAVSGAWIYGAKIYDNVDPAAISNGTATGGTGARAIETVGACGRVDILGCDFNCRDRVNESYTIDVSTSTTSARLLFNRLELESRATGGGNLIFMNTSTLFKDNMLGTFTPTVSWSGGNTVASLPTASNAYRGDRRIVTDSTLAYSSVNVGTTVVGGAANVTPVFCTGAAWVIG